MRLQFNEVPELNNHSEWIELGSLPDTYRITPILYAPRNFSVYGQKCL
jgi:hypothetical protein